MRKLLVALALLAVPGCAPARLDTSSDDALKASIKRMTAGMDDARKKRFTGGLVLLTMQDAMRSALAGKGAERPGMPAMLKPYDGMTAAEIEAKIDERVKAMEAARKR